MILPSIHENKSPVVIWDMGGILYHFFTEVLVKKGEAEGWPMDKIPLGPTGTISDPDYKALSIGKINEPEYVKRLVKLFSRHGIDYCPYDDADLAPPPERTEVWSLIDTINKLHWRQMLLTNDASNWLGKGWWEKWPHRHLFDYMVDVKNVGVSKPSPDPYLACLDKFGVPSSDCIFIDDMHVNCAGAEAVGMQSHWFDITDPPSTIAKLKVRLGI